ncbi:MAG: methyltransferase domain-containing protein [Actinophytocola sp.]|nr:methyltransferase domain-containing protein [Actinophytocola sp.]
MAMNLLHRRLCASRLWRRHMHDTVLPWALDGLDLGAVMLEIGPGYGANIPALLARTSHLTVLEIDDDLAARLRARFGDTITVVDGDGAASTLPDAVFSAVVCFTMLHHVPTAARQNALFAEACRLLRPGGVFAGSDGRPSAGFALIHLGDTYNPVRPDALPERLATAGFTDIDVDTRGPNQRFRARKP